MQSINADHAGASGGDRQDFSRNINLVMCSRFMLWMYIFLPSLKMGVSWRRHGHLEVDRVF